MAKKRTGITTTGKDFKAFYLGWKWPWGEPDDEDTTIEINGVNSNDALDDFSEIADDATVYFEGTVHFDKCYMTFPGIPQVAERAGYNDVSRRVRQDRRRPGEGRGGCRGREGDQVSKAKEFEAAANELADAYIKMMALSPREVPATKEDALACVAAFAIESCIKGRPTRMLAMAVGVANTLAATDAELTKCSAKLEEIGKALGLRVSRYAN